MDSQDQQFDLVLPPNIQYTACAKGHTYHPEQWPVSGTISIDKCERQCRFPTCRSWSQTAAALRKHVNSHILNNNLNLRVIPASNGREPMRITSGQTLTPSPNSYSPWAAMTPPPVAYPPAVSAPLSRDPSDSGYATRGSSIQPASFDDSHWSPKRSPDFSGSEPPPKRNRTEFYGEVDHSHWPGSEITPAISGDSESNERPLRSSSSDPKSAEMEHERAMYVQRLDTLLAKVQILKEATAQASSIRKDRLNLRHNSITSADIHDPNFLPSVRIAQATAAHLRELNKSGRNTPSVSPEPKVSATPISSEIRSLEYHESEAESLSLPQQSDGERRPSMSNATFGFENAEFSDRLSETSPHSESTPESHALREWNPEPNSRQETGESTKEDEASGNTFSPSHDSTDNPLEHFSGVVISEQKQEINYRDNRLQCNACHKYVKTKSELKKHDLRHTKPYRCEVVGCPRMEGFSTPNDLERHARVKHSPRSTGRYKCRFPGCKSENKGWPRLDNFRSHLKRMHSRYFTETGIENLVRGAQFDSAVADIVEEELHVLKPQTPGSIEHVRESDIDLHSLHVLADSAVFGRYYQRSQDLAS